MFEKGEIVLIPFPFTDLSAKKTRPTVVVSTPGFEKATGNITVAMITSVQYATPFDHEIRDWKTANLLAPSWARAKVATLDPALVRYNPGRLSEHDMAGVDKILRLAHGH